jgi:hypothetical protein
MATMQKNEGQGQQQRRENKPGTGIGSPLSNDAYNIIAALHAKLEGMEAYRKFAFDGDEKVWQELTDCDQKCVDVLIERLEEIVKAGKLRAARSEGGGVKA